MLNKEKDNIKICILGLLVKEMTVGIKSKLVKIIKFSMLHTLFKS